MDFKIEETFCFTGHRPDKLYGYDKTNEGNVKLISLINSAIIIAYNNGIRNFISGMALGWDQWAALEVIKLKEKYPDMKLITAIPCIDHPNAWPKESQDEWRYIFYFADSNNYISNMPYRHNSMQRRNEWMVNHSIGQIAGWNGSKGGTANCINYANKRNKTNRILINPQTFSVKMFSEFS